MGSFTSISIKVLEKRKKLSLIPDGNLLVDFSKRGGNWVPELRETSESLRVSPFLRLSITLERIDSYSAPSGDSVSFVR